MITILTAPYGTFQKTYTPSGSQDYDRVKTVVGEERALRDLVDLYDLLAELQDQPNKCIIRGRPVAPGVQVRRTYREESEPGFLAQDLDWLCVDIDGHELGDVDMYQPFKWIATYEPAPMRGAGCVLQWSSSMGVKPGLRVHLWYMLDRAVADRSVKSWIKGLGAYDTGLYQPVQPHYTAAPRFDGVEDPLRWRLWMRQGPRVVLPKQVCDMAAWAKREQLRTERERLAAKVRTSQVAWAAKEAGRYERAALRRACEAITGSLEGQRHDTIRKEAWSMWRFVEAGGLEESVWYSELLAAAQSVLPSSRHGEIARLLEGAKRPVR